MVVGLQAVFAGEGFKSRFMENAFESWKKDRKDWFRHVMDWLCIYL